MVGYTLIGIDSWKGEVAAYDIGTGITKPHRGKGLARGMFDHALPRLRDAGVKTFVLEVLQQNEPAIKAYEKVGFRITRAFDCFELPCEKTVERGAVSVVELEREDIHLFEKELDWLPSWENSISSIMRVPDELLVYGAVVDGAPRGAIVYYPALSWIMLIAVEKAYRRRGIGLSLLRHLAYVLGGGAPVVRIVNIQSDDRGMTAFLEGAGFERFVGQYEMELAI